MSADEMESIKSQLTKQDEVLHEIRSALVGNKAMGHKGLVDQVQEHGKSIAEHDRKLVFATGAAVAVSSLLSAAKIKLFGG